MVLRRVVVAGFLCAAFVIGSALPSAASCAPPLPLTEALASADLVVVGTVTAARSANRIATVAVEDIWKGDADTVIEVAGGPDSANGATSVDRTYVVGESFLFFIFEPALHGSSGTFGARYEDNGCTDTRPYTSDLDQLRPSTARRTATSSSASSSSTTSSAPSTSASGNAGVALFGLAGLIGCGALALLVWRVRQRTRRATA